MKLVKADVAICPCGATATKQFMSGGRYKCVSCGRTDMERDQVNWRVRIPDIEGVVRKMREAIAASREHGNEPAIWSDVVEKWADELEMKDAV